MKKDIKRLIVKLNYIRKQKRLWQFFVGILSCIVIFITIYLLMIPAITLNADESYTLHLIDSYEASWKTKENGYTTSYDVKLHFTDTKGNILEGSDLTLEISPNSFEDDPYGFGYVPYTSATNTTPRGQDLIQAFDLYEYYNANGDKYVFDHAEVYINGVWQKLTGDGIRWHIWCQNSSSTTEPENKNYSWRGRYGTEESIYTITNDTEYKFVYKLVRYGIDKTVASLGADSGISFTLFNYTGDNDETGINNNGIYNYFTFRDSSRELDVKINSTIDGDGFYTDTRAYVENKLDSEGYPIFDCQGECATNPSLGYLFGSSTNPLGNNPEGVTEYTPTNTLLQKENIDGIDYYYYDSNRNAVDYDTDNDRFLVRNYVERSYTMTGYTNEADRYEFMPFNYLNDEIETKNNETTGRTYNYETSEIDHWYGMTMEFEFYMPANGKINGKDMIFSFTGDDDVWVFIDDVLVLDLGGTHGSVDGTINFATGVVEGYLNWNSVVGTTENGRRNTTNIYQAFTDANSTIDTKWNSTNTTFANYTKHTLKFFYLERGAAVANCKIKFNIPVLPSGSFSIQKQFEGTDNYNENYEFTLYDTTSGTSVPVANTKYTIGSTEYTTDANGCFALKTGEEAIFKLTNEHTYYVEETNTGEHAVSYECSFDGEECPTITKTNEFTIDPESSYQAVFTNKIKTYDLNVTKEVYGESSETFEFQISLSKSGNRIDIPDAPNSEYTVDHTTGTVTFSLKKGETITVKDIPVDTNVTLKETKHDGYNTIIKNGIETLAEGDTYTFTLTSNKDITVHNIPGVTLPETGSTGILNYLIIGMSLMLLSLKYGYKYCINLKEGDR